MSLRTRSFASGKPSRSLALEPSSKSWNSKPGATVQPTKEKAVPSFGKEPNHVPALTVYCAYGGHYDNIELLLENGADPNLDFDSMSSSVTRSIS